MIKFVGKIKKRSVKCDIIYSLNLVPRSEGRKEALLCMM